MQITKMKLAEIKRLNTGYFFTRSTMKFFGDKMTSFGVRTFEGKRVLYRKPNAMVNVFGEWKRAGKIYFSCWIVSPKGAGVEIEYASEDFKTRFYNSL